MKSLFLILFCEIKVGGIAAATSAEKSMEWMAGSSAVLGFGMGTVFATGLAWIEDLLNLNNWLGTMLVISGEGKMRRNFFLKNIERGKMRYSLSIRRRRSQNPLSAYPSF